uniref:Uncharacterized protein n=1 Tax=Cannabis sativa TaxID=3483 RepID=A0A803PTC4_CANSA
MRRNPVIPFLADQGIPSVNTNNATNAVNLSLSPAVHNDVVVPNIAVVAALPTGNQVALTNNPTVPGGIDQENLLRALRVIKQQIKPIYKLH